MLYEEYDYDHCRECSCELTDDNRKLWSFFEIPMCKKCYRRHMIMKHLIRLGAGAGLISLLAVIVGSLMGIVYLVQYIMIPAFVSELGSTGIRTTVSVSILFYLSMCYIIGGILVEDGD